MKSFTHITLAGLIIHLILFTSNIKSEQSQQERVCTVASADLSKLTFEVFDQGLDSPLSWRCIALKGDFKGARELIDKYQEINQPRLEPYMIQALNFHSGQLAAMDGKYEDAIEKFHQALDDNNEAADYLSWNEYVSGTIYFLQGDIGKLEQEIKKIESRNLEMDGANLRILKSYLRCPDETYKEVYSRTSSCLNARN